MKEIKFSQYSLLVDELEEAEQKVHHVILNGGFGYSVAINAEKIIRCVEDDKFYEMVKGAEVRVCDGVAVRFFSEEPLQKINWPGKIIQLARIKKYQIATVGGTKETAHLVERKLNEQGLNVLKSIDGYKPTSEIVNILESIEANIVFLGLGSPRQEYIASELARKNCKFFLVCCGGALDVISGKKAGAPRIIADSNFEWLYRLVLQPSRFQRYMNLRKIFYIKLGWMNGG